MGRGLRLPARHLLPERQLAANPQRNRLRPRRHLRNRLLRRLWRGSDKDRVIDGKLDPTDMFVLYVRRNFENGGDGRIWAGATGNGDGLLGADLWVPLGKGFALENRINYMIPKQGRGDTAQTRESWGL